MSRPSPTSFSTHGVSWLSGNGHTGYQITAYVNGNGPTVLRAVLSDTAADDPILDYMYPIDGGCQHASRSRFMHTRSTRTSRVCQIMARRHVLWQNEMAKTADPQMGEPQTDEDLKMAANASTDANAHRHAN